MKMEAIAPPNGRAPVREMANVELLKASAPPDAPIHDLTDIQVTKFWRLLRPQAKLWGVSHGEAFFTLMGMTPLATSDPAAPKPGFFDRQKFEALNEWLAAVDSTEAGRRGLVRYTDKEHAETLRPYLADFATWSGLNNSLRPGHGARQIVTALARLIESILGG